MLCKGFNFKWKGQNLCEIILENGGDDRIDYSIRVLEMETAMAFSVIFDDSWYSIPMKTRAVMIAGRIGRNWIESLDARETAIRSSSRSIVN